jgi:hypothetical protein
VVGRGLRARTLSAQKTGIRIACAVIIAGPALPCRSPGRLPEHRRTRWGQTPPRFAHQDPLTDLDRRQGSPAEVFFTLPAEFRICSPLTSALRAVWVTMVTRSNNDRRKNHKARGTLCRQARIEAFESLLSTPVDAPWTERYPGHYDLHRAFKAAARASRQKARRAKIRRPGMAGEKPEAAVTCTEFARRARDTAGIVHARLKAGFNWPGGYVTGKPRQGCRGYYRLPFLRHGLVSAEHPVLRLFVASTPRASRLAAGQDKGAVTVGGPKVLSLDAAYVVTNRDMRRVLRVELDSDWDSWTDLREAVLACGARLPNIVVGHVHEAAGRLQSPHLIWLLEHPVCFTASGIPRHQTAFRAILRSLTYALRPIGADPGGLANALKMKNPVSPKWSHRVWTEQPFPCFDAVRAGLPWGVTKAMLFGGRTAPADVEGRPRTALGSNGMFRALRSFAFGNIARHHPDGEAKGSRGEFAIEVTRHGCEIAEATGATEDRARATAAKVVEYTWTHFDGEKWRARKKRGACAAQAKGKSRSEAQGIGGRHGAATRRRNTIGKLVAAFSAIVAETGTEPSCAALATAAGVSRRTVERCRNTLIAAMSADATDSAIVKKVAVPESGPFAVLPVTSQSAGRGSRIQAHDAQQHRDGAPTLPRRGCDGRHQAMAPVPRAEVSVEGTHPVSQGTR